MNTYQKVHNKFYQNYSGLNMFPIVYYLNFNPFGKVYQPPWKRQLAIAINRVRASET
jgi:hypothetical protein